MIYYANPCTPAIVEAMVAGRLGMIDTPKQGNALVPGVRVIGDNGCFSDKWDEREWLDWLEAHPPMEWAVAPDVVDLSGRETHDETVDRWRRYAPLIRRMGHTPAFVCQPGATWQTIPDDAEILFIGGTTGWKLGGMVEHIVDCHSDRWVHMGRVNSFRRLKYANDIGCDSVDGTLLTFGPELHLPRLLSWLDRLPAFPHKRLVFA